MRRTLLYLFLLGVTLTLYSHYVFAENLQRISSPNEISYEPKLRLNPLSLPGGSTLTVVSREEWTPLVSKLSTLLLDTHARYEGLLGKPPPFTVTLRLMDEEQFYKATNAPRWTNAMYYKGEITVPLSLNEEIDLENLFRSIKHEYTHAVIHALSGGRCPGWLDEGLAQWAEGPENPALEPALRAWILDRAPVPLSMLQGGFTKLKSEMVPPAYAQSLFATKNVINGYGFDTIKRFLENLRGGRSKDTAFQKSFQISLDVYEKRLGISLKKWAHEHM